MKSRKAKIELRRVGGRTVQETTMIELDDAEADTQEAVVTRTGAGEMERVERWGFDRAQFSALLDHENRLRALEGRKPTTAKRLRDWLVARL